MIAIIKLTINLVYFQKINQHLKIKKLIKNHFNQKVSSLKTKIKEIHFKNPKNFRIKFNNFERQKTILFKK